MTDGCQDGCQYPQGHWFLRGEKIHNQPLRPPLPTVTHRLRVLECFRGLWILKDHPLARGRSQIPITRFLDAVGRTPWAPDLENQNRDLELMSSSGRNHLDERGQDLQSPRCSEVLLLMFVNIFFWMWFFFFFFWKKAKCKFVDSDDQKLRVVLICTLEKQIIQNI